MNNTTTPEPQKPGQFAEARGSASRADWYISLKNAQGRWMQVITVSDRTREEAEKCAKEGLRYYEGTTDWRVSLAPNAISSATGRK